MFISCSCIFHAEGLGEMRESVCECVCEKERESVCMCEVRFVCSVMPSVILKFI